MIRKIGLGAADQALLSIASFAISVFAARSLTTTGFGAFALALSVYWVALGLSRGFHSEPLMVRFGSADPHRIGSAARIAATSALGYSIVSGALLIVGAAVLQIPDVPETLIALGVCLPILLLVDLQRFSAFACGQGATALMADVLWNAFAVAAVLLLAASSSPKPWSFALAWGLAAIPAALLMALRTGVRPTRTSPINWVKGERILAPRYALESLVTSGTSQIAMLVVATVAGVAAVGGIRGAIVVMGPVTVIFLAANLIAIPEAVRALDRSHASLRKFTVLLSGVLAGTAIAWGALAVAAIPDSLGTQLLGATWTTASDALVPMCVAVAATGASTGAFIGLRALAASSASLGTRLAVAPLTIAAAVAGGLAGGTVGAAWGIAIANTLAGGLWWSTFLRRLRDPLTPRQATRRAEAST